MPTLCLRRPFVIVDEAHNQSTQLAVFAGRVGPWHRLDSFADDGAMRRADTGSAVQASTFPSVRQTFSKSASVIHGLLLMVRLRAAKSRACGTSCIGTTSSR